MPRGDVKKLCVTTKIEKWYNARDNVLNFDLRFLLRAEFGISPKDTAEENGKLIPKIFVSIF